MPAVPQTWSSRGALQHNQEGFKLLMSEAAQKSSPSTSLRMSQPNATWTMQKLLPSALHNRLDSTCWDALPFSTQSCPGTKANLRWDPASIIKKWIQSDMTWERAKMQQWKLAGVFPPPVPWCSLLPSSCLLSQYLGCSVGVTPSRNVPRAFPGSEPQCSS